MESNESTDRPLRALDVLSEPVRQAVASALGSDERVLWAGRPVAWAAWGDLMPSTMATRPLRLLMLLITGGTALRVLGFVVMAGTQALIARQLADAVQLERFDLCSIETPALHRLRRDGVGDVVFSGIAVLEIGDDGGSDGYATFDLGFTSCPDAEQVLGLMAEAREERRTRKSTPPRG